MALAAEASSANDVASLALAAFELATELSIAAAFASESIPANALDTEPISETAMAIEEFAIPLP